MNMGLGFSEILLIVVLVLVFFGSKELPSFIREAARWLAKARHYSDKVKRELNDIAQSVNNTATDQPVSSTASKKQELRRKFREARRALSEQERAAHSEKIWQHVLSSKPYSQAQAVMVYVSYGSEVDTRAAIQKLLSSGKRVVVPYCCTATRDLGIAEIRDPQTDLAASEHGILEPIPDLRDKFFRSDLQAIICPGLGFDIYGGRLGQGKAYYDNFLRELKGRVPIAGVAFSCQVSNEPLPFDYNDVPLDQIFTENGPVLPLGMSTDATANKNEPSTVLNPGPTTQL